MSPTWRGRRLIQGPLKKKEKLRLPDENAEEGRDGGGSHGPEAESANRSRGLVQLKRSGGLCWVRTKEKFGDPLGKVSEGREVGSHAAVKKKRGESRGFLGD